MILHFNTGPNALETLPIRPNGSPPTEKFPSIPKRWGGDDYQYPLAHRVHGTSCARNATTPVARRSDARESWNATREGSHYPHTCASSTLLQPLVGYLTCPMPNAPRSAAMLSTPKTSRACRISRPHATTHEDRERHCFHSRQSLGIRHSCRKQWNSRVRFRSPF